jgi:tetratricopeptide (TPR) repeat protein
MAKHARVQRAIPQTTLIVAICAVLVGTAWFVFAQTLGHQFVTYDDPQYVYANPDVSAGVSLTGISWAFTHTIAGHWHPLTTLSHMLDCQLFKLNPSGHHFTSVFLHSIAVVFLFLVLRQMTGSLWRSAFVAAVFAIHPLHVESVAWISERKDVLSAVFFMLTLAAYLRYVRAPSVTAYLLLLLVFALGLMSKSMLVTVPFLLLLLDYWPLGRITLTSSPKPTTREQATRSHWSIVGRLAVEKIPLLVLSALSSVVTFRSAGTIDQLPLTWRLGNAALSYVVYVWQMFWPTQLAPFYPHPNGQLPLWQIILATTLLITVSLLAVHWRKERPYIFTGWFWYVGMLVPVIGLVQAGEQARADRYTYLSQIGLYVLVTWGIADLMKFLMVDWQSPAGAARKIPAQRLRAGRTKADTFYSAFQAVIAAAIIALLSWRASVQTSYWRNNQVLWNHTLAVTSDNDVAQYNLGYYFLQRGDLDNAITRFETALQIRAHNNGAPNYNSGTAVIENNLANLLAQKGRLAEAVDHYHNAMELRPGYGDPHLNLGNVLFEEGQLADAMAQWQMAHGTEPKDGRFHTALGDALLRAGLQRDAISEYEYAARISAQDPLPRNKLAWLLATSSDTSIRDGNRALELANQAVNLSRRKDPNSVRTLAAAYAETGRFAEAEETARQALRAAELQKDRTLINAVRDEIALYELGLPYHTEAK